MLIYGRQRRHRFYYRHLISPTRHGCTTHSEMRYLQVELVTKSILSIHSVSVMTQIFFIDCQQHWKYDRTMNTGANAHGKRAVSTLEIATSDRLDLRWQLGFQWHGIGIEIVLQVPRLFHNATVSQCDHFLLLHMYMYLLFETSPGWRGFFKLNFVGATELQCIYYLCRILISRPPRVFRRFKRRSCLKMHPFGGVFMPEVLVVGSNNNMYFTTGSGPHLNIKTIFPRYGDSHVKYKTVIRLSYL